MQEQEEEDEDEGIERERERRRAFFKGIINSLNALVVSCNCLLGLSHVIVSYDYLL